jgi:hypothetical protein
MVPFVKVWAAGFNSFSCRPSFWSIMKISAAVYVELLGLCDRLGMSPEEAIEFADQIYRVEMLKDTKLYKLLNGDADETSE